MPYDLEETINALQAFRKRNADAKAAHAQVKDQKTDVSERHQRWDNIQLHRFWLFDAHADLILSTLCHPFPIV